MECTDCGKDAVFVYGEKVEFGYCIKHIERGLAVWRQHVINGNEERGWTIKRIPLSSEAMAWLL